MRRNAILFSCLLFCACATAALSPEGEKVRIVHEREAIADCKLLGIVEFEGRAATAETPLNTFRNKAAVLGADTVLVNKGATVLPQTSASAYRCAK
jgi:hypothetical protein